MGNPLGGAKALVPRPLRRGLRALQRRMLFRRAMRQFRRDPARCARRGHAVLRDLAIGWDNSGWAADEGYLVECVQQAMRTTGPILECGSGLSTLLVGIIAQQRKVPHFALEHTPEWARRVRAALRRCGATNVVVLLSPLRDYGEFEWYDPPLASLPSNFGCVICDGPPGGTRGGRYGLMPVFGNHLARKCIVLLDDASRPGEQEVLARWQSQRDVAIEPVEGDSSYVRVVVP